MAEVLDLRALIDHYRIPLRNERGGKAMAVCGFPFHEDKGPSLSLDFNKGVFNCFGCGKGGGPIQFVQLMEGCDWSTAVARTGEILGVEIKIKAREILPAVVQGANKKYALFMRLSKRHPWLTEVVTWESMLKLSEELFRAWQWEERERRDHVGKFLYFKIERDIDLSLMDIEAAWRASIDADLNRKLGEAHRANDEEGYFALWDERVDTMVFERDLLGEVRRITMKVLDRGKLFLSSENKRKFNLGREIMVSWSGVLKRLKSTGLKRNVSLILEWGYVR